MVFVRCLNQVPIMVNDHTLRHLYTSTIVVEVNWAKVLVTTLLLNLWCIA